MNTRMTKAAWVRRRARRIMAFYKVSRREAVVTACTDWTWRKNLNEPSHR